MSAQQVERETALKAAEAAIKAGDYAAALGQAEALFGDNPADKKALYMAAVACRFLKRFDEATSYLRQLHRQVPEYGRAWQELGHVALARGDREMAITAFTQATRSNASLVGSWRILVRLLVEAGRISGATEARTQLQRISALAPELLAANNHLGEGRLAKAEEICRNYLRRSPDDIEGMRLLAKIGIKNRSYEDAEALLERAVALAPGDTNLRLDYIEALHWQQKYAKAYAEAERLHAADPKNPLFQSHLAIESMQTGDDERAVGLFDKVLEQLPNDFATHISRGHALQIIGRTDEAIGSYREALKVAPDSGDAWYALANLKRFAFSEQDLVTMQTYMQRGDLAFNDQVSLAFALGKAFEDRREYEASFHHYELGNSLKRAQTGYDADAMTEELRRQQEICTSKLFEEQAGSGYHAPDPIFIVGLPRAGSTLLEQILASHSQIEGTLEWPNVLALAHRLRGADPSSPNYPQILHDLSPETLVELGEKLIDDTRVHRRGAPYFIDKMPNNFRHIGLIHLILPNAKIIDARRAPLDCCFSAFKQHFALGQEFTYGLHEIGRYYVDYIDLMDHWDAVLPGKVLRVQHEDVLDDLEGQTRRMLEYLGMPFEEACLEFHKTDRAIRTPSSEQVRQPINRQGQGAWKPFEPWLGPLKEALGLPA